MKAKILLKYENKWVALNSTRTKVLYAASTINRLSKILSNTKEKNVILHYVTPFKGFNLKELSHREYMVSGVDILRRIRQKSIFG